MRTLQFRSPGIAPVNADESAPSTNFPEYFNINGQKVTDKTVIANEFNFFFSVKLIKFAKNELCKPITTIVNQCLETSIFPDKLKIAKVILLFKKGDQEQIDNYRPISILPAISKIIEKVMFIQLYEYFNTNNLLYKSQYGVRPKHTM